jgi:FAD/FMN-containing dehydrogenase
VVAGAVIAIEHGLGTLKRGRPAPVAEVQRAIKAAFDPRGVMNPGKKL